MRHYALNTPFWYAVFPILTAALSILILLVLLRGATFVPAMLVMLAANVVIGLATAGRIITIGRAFRQLAPVITTAQSLTFLDGDDLAPIVGTIRADVRQLARLKTIARWVSSNPLMTSWESSLLACFANDLCRVIYEYLNLAFLFDWNAVYVGAPQLRAKAPHLLRA
jgi:hypothetical protein